MNGLCALTAARKTPRLLRLNATKGKVLALGISDQLRTTYKIMMMCTWNISLLLLNSESLLRVDAPACVFVSNKEDIISKVHRWCPRKLAPLWTGSVDGLSGRAQHDT